MLQLMLRKHVDEGTMGIRCDPGDTGLVENVRPGMDV